MLATCLQLRRDYGAALALLLPLGLSLSLGPWRFLTICYHGQSCGVFNVQSLLTAVVLFPSRLSHGAGIAGSFRWARSGAVGEAAGFIHGTLAAFKVTISRSRVPRFATHRERDDGEELDADRLVGRCAGRRGSRLVKGDIGFALLRAHNCAVSLSQGCAIAPSPGQMCKGGSTE